MLQVAQPETQASQETPKEPVESFWATIVEEDEQGLFSENVNKTLAECLHLTEQVFILLYTNIMILYALSAWNSH